jgi:glycosyltransferase involved in cell wall biosynthesis
MVSRHQHRSFPFFLQTKIRKLVIAEVPYLSVMPNKAKGAIPPSIGFVGRIHHERGLDLWIEIANCISGIDREVTFVIIGDGVDREVFFSGFDPETHSKVRYLGWLNSIDLDTAWESVGVLLVTADSESFGVVMREALVRGIFVVAFENQASLSLKEQFPNCVFTSKNAKDLAEMAIVKSKLRLSDSAVDSIISTLVTEQKSAIQAIAKSWLQDLQSH